jgi:hypothetical protein
MTTYSLLIYRVAGRAEPTQAPVAQGPMDPIEESPPLVTNGTRVQALTSASSEPSPAPAPERVRQPEPERPTRSADVPRATASAADLAPPASNEPDSAPPASSVEPPDSEDTEAVAPSGLPGHLGYL